METTTSKTVFIEYSSSRPGQHFMTVIQTMNHQRVIIGRIYRDFDQANKKTIYKAYDFNGDQIFPNGIDLNDLKSRFKRSGKMLAEMVMTHQQGRQVKSLAQGDSNSTRKQEIKTIRDSKTDKGKEKVKDQRKPKEHEKADLTRMEKEQDEKNQVHSQGHLRDIDKAANPSSEKEDYTGMGKNAGAENQPDQAEIDEREMEIEDIRSERDDLEQDHDIDL